MTLHAQAGALYPTPPFDLGKSLEFMARFAPSRNAQAPRSQPFGKAVCVNGQTVAFRIESVGTMEEPKLNYTLLSKVPFDEATSAAALRRINLYLSLDDDLRPFYEIGRNDPHFAPVIEQLYGYHQVKFLSPFEAGCWAILTQRTALPDTRKMKAYLTKRYGSSLEVDGTTRWAFPEPEQIMAASPDELEPLVGSRQKAEYLSALAHALDKVDEEFLLKASYAEVEAWLRGIRGIGQWSAVFIMLRGLGRPERAPLDEWRLLEAIARVYNGGKRMSKEAIEPLLRRYGPWQGYWAHYLRAAA